MNSEEVRKILEGENRVFILNEGICPDCFHEVKLVSISGIGRFLEDYSLDQNKNVKMFKWEGPVNYAIGQFLFECQNPECDVAHCIEQDKSGDWS